MYDKFFREYDLCELETYTLFTLYCDLVRQIAKKKSTNFGMLENLESLIFERLEWTKDDMQICMMDGEETEDERLSREHDEFVQYCCDNNLTHLL